MEELLDASFSARSMSYQGKQAISSSQNFLFLYNILSVNTQLIIVLIVE
jgi:hypothetical protein